MTGGGAFCAGVDLDDFAEITSTLGRQEVLRDRVHRVAAAALDLDKPLIAAVDGVAVGAGMDMALACDIRLASTRARFSEAYVRVGLIPGDGGAHLLPRIVGQARALELLWTGRFVEAEEALELGLVLSLHDPEELPTAAITLCRHLADGPPVAIRAIKRLVRNGERVDFATSLSMVAAEQAVVQSTRDSAEAIGAFREKRTPRFIGE
ncbi:enoyl-CoA hydratase-related protein [Nocardia sp. NPDC050193]